MRASKACLGEVPPSWVRQMPLLFFTLLVPYGIPVWLVHGFSGLFLFVLFAYMELNL